MNKTRQNDRAVYLVCFDNFAATKSDIVSETGLSKAQVTKSLNRLIAAEIVADGYDVNEEAQGSSRRGQYKELVFQCYATYDSISRDEAIALFDKRFPENDDKPDYRSRKRSESSKKAAATRTKDAGGKKVPLTNSRRRALLRLAAGPQYPTNQLASQPFLFFRDRGLATQKVEGDHTKYTITKAGRERAADIDASKYGEVK